MFVQEENDLEGLVDDDEDEDEGGAGGTGGTARKGGKKGGINPGRRKIEIEYIEDKVGDPTDDLARPRAPLTSHPTSTYAVQATHHL